MPYHLRNSRPSPLHIPDAGLRLEPGQQVIVASLTPQLTSLLAIGALALVSTPLAPVPPEMPVTSADPTAMRQTRSGHRNAAEVLPPRLLARVQRVVTGYVTIPPPVTRADQRRHTLAALHRQGATPHDIAAALQVSRRHVARLLRSLSAADAPASPAHPLPAPLLAQVQRYMTGRLYVPPAPNAAARRRQQLQRAFQAGEPTGEIARRLQCSARQVRRERARWRDAQARAVEGQAHDVR